ncbi:MAG: matrixin family metalloprotease [Candidatus Aenigmarchaeota archaeon]|nr:matrixin family metalloprotease [Candidatus Aenigmarchaeota archaeon]
MRIESLIVFAVLAVFLVPLFAAETNSAITVGGTAGVANQFTLPKTAVKVADDVYSLGEAAEDGVKLEGYAFIHRKELIRTGFISFRIPLKCYGFLSAGSKWKVTEPYILNPANADNLSDAFVADRINKSMEAWNSQIAFRVFGARINGTADGADSIAPDGKNEIMFGRIGEKGAIAMTIVWGIFSGPVSGRKLVEYDMVFDDDDFKWGDAGQTSETRLGNTGIMDLQNVATHELGHAAGMGHPSDMCSQETMYRFTKYGETKKRTLYSGDIAGIKALYK